MSSTRGASAWSAAIAACAWYSPSWSLRERGLQDGDSLGDELGVPLAPVLLGERHDPSVRSGAAAAARVVQQHQCEQPVDLGVVHRRRQLPGQPDRLGGQVDVARVALVEDEVQHPHHRAHVAGTIDAGPTDRALGAADALRHGALGHEVGLRDLARGEPAHGPQGQGDRRGRGQLGVRAQEVEVQGVVGARHHTGRRLGVESDLSIATRRVRPGQVDERSPGDRDQPALGIGGQLVLPRGECPDERLLHRVLGRREVCTATDEDAQDLRDELAQLDVVHGHSVTVGGAVRKGRTSSHSWIGSPPAPGAADSSPASSIARS